MELSEEVDEFIKRIENKYAQDDSSTAPKNNLEEQLFILSKEFDTLGFPVIDINQSKTKLLEEIVCNTLLLIQVHRKTLSQMNDISVTNKQKDIKNCDLQNTIQSLKMKIKQTETENNKMTTTVKRLNSECLELKAIITSNKKDTERIKKSCNSKLNDLIHNVSSLKQENDRLKEICGQNFDKRLSKEECFVNILKQHRRKEETYKSALQKLEENNAEIMNEILNLRTELAVMYSKENQK